jgi:hypothetical protein
MTAPYALNGHPYVLYYKEYTSLKVNLNTLSGENLETIPVLGFEEKHVWADFCKNIFCHYSLLRHIVLHMDEFCFIHRITT